MDIAAELREAASRVREAAALMHGTGVEKTSADREELDPEKIRDFLLFYGARHD